MSVYGPRYGQPQPPGFREDGTYKPSEYFMQLAIDSASGCVDRGQHPVGAVVTRVLDVFDADIGRKQSYEFVAGVGVNEVETHSGDHAEDMAIERAETQQGRRRLAALRSVLYTTHEPCPMCAGLVANSKLEGVVFGTSAADAAYLVATEGIKWRSNRVSGLDVIRGRVEAGMKEQFIIGGFMRDQCLDLLRTAGQLTVAKTS